MEKIRSIYMKKTIFAILALFAITGLFSQQQPVVAVAPFDVISGVSATDAAMITDVFFVRLGNTRKVDLVNRTIVQRVIREHNFQSEDWSNKEKTAELGKALNADWIVQGDIRKMNNGILIIVQFYNIKTFKFEGGTDLRLANADEAYDKMNPLVDSLIKTIGDTGTRPAGNSPTPSAQTYKIGDTGPGGGIVFYDKGVFSGGWRYLEAAPVETEFTAPWSASEEYVQSISTAVGSGKRNTELIVERLRQLGENGSAAQVCVSLNFDGYKDWFLPSKDELNLMYKNLKRKRLGGFSNIYYWSSSQANVIIYAWYQHFGSGNQIDYRKANTLSVRAVRAF
jgi:TolB-like protein